MNTMDWSKQKLELSPDDVETGKVRDVTIVREVDDINKQTADGRKYTLFVFTVQAPDKKRYTFSLFENAIQPVTRFIQDNKLDDEMGLRLTLGVVLDKNKDGSPRKNFQIVKVEGPAQVTL